MSFLKSTAFAALSLSLFAASPSSAQIDTRTACRQDVEVLCASEYRARNRDKVRACLQANIAKASQGCQVAVKAQMAATKARAAKSQ